MQSLVRDPVVGRLVAGRYQVLARIARGGMATVYRAEDVRLGREIALKVMHPHLAESAEFVDRFRDEARAAASISSRTVVAVHDAGEDGELVWLAMELLPGRTVRDLLRSRGGFTPAEAFDVLQALLAALSEAHAVGLIHRDVKPENILVARDGSYKVNDFGLARAVHSSRTATGSLLGTPEYIAPETAQTGQVDARVDLYSAGIVLFELLTGMQPHTGQVPFQVVWAHVTTDVPAPSSIAHHLPPEVDELVAWACAREPEQRPASAEEMLEGLRRVWSRLDPEVLDASPPSRVVPDGDDGTRSTDVLDRPTEGVSPPRPGASTVSISRSDLPSDDDGAAAGAAGASSAVGVQQSTTRPTRRPRRRIGTVLLLTLFALSIVAGGVFTWFELGPGAQREVPDVLGQTADAATTQLAEAGLASATTSVFDEEAPVGSVVDTQPAPGDSIHKDGTVTLVVSSGPQLFPVPDLVGGTEEAARAALEEANLVLGEMTEAYDATAPVGSVVSSDPPAGEELRRDTEVDVVLSRGPQPVAVPEVVGRTLAAARADIESAGLTVAGEVGEAYDSTAPAGSVLSQEPADGELLPGQAVTLQVSLGPEPVPVPDLFDARYDTAAQELQELGFAVERRGSSLLNRVVAQDPAPGTPLTPGSTVVLTTF